MAVYAEGLMLKSWLGAVYLCLLGDRGGHLAQEEQFRKYFLDAKSPCFSSGSSPAFDGIGWVPLFADF